MAKIELTHVTKRWGGFYAVDDLSLTIGDNAFVTLLGPSGCGKTTTLRMIAGLETPTEGRIEIDGTLMFDSERGVNIPANKRRVGFLFQNYALWPNMTVYQNISFGLSNINESGASVNERGEVVRDETGKSPARKLTREEIDRAVKRVSQIVKIGMFMDRYPSELSGGQQQRVAIARTLAPGPKVLFMDEPLSNLDAKLRLEMRSELQRLHLETGSTFVYVTHDQMEAMTLATQICLIDNGLLQQYDEPLTIYNRPANLFVADFVGNPAINFIDAKGTLQNGVLKFSAFEGTPAVFTAHKGFDEAAWREESALLDTRKEPADKTNKSGAFNYRVARVEDDAPTAEGDYVIGVRPEFVFVAEDGGIEAEVFSAMPTGMETTLKLRIGNFLLTSVVFAGVSYKLGQRVRLSVRGGGVMLFDRKSGRFMTTGSLSLE